MIRTFRCFFAGLTVLLATGTAVAQSQQTPELHKVKKKETLFGIARQYGLTIQELVEANPEMNRPGYELKKDDYVIIPQRKSHAADVQQAPVPQSITRYSTPHKGAVKLGVMLPLHDANGDGRRMIEYYRGVLMACDSLKKRGYSIDVYAWSTPDTKDIAPVLRESAAKECDLIIGPLYSMQMSQLSEFASRHDIKLIIPFSISVPELASNSNIFQVYQSPNAFNDGVIEQFVNRFTNYHPVFIDCNDSTSTKGNFTSGLRRRLEVMGIDYGITNLKSSESKFARAFSQERPNVVILNSGKGPELNVAIAKLNGLTAAVPGLKITLFGYQEWMLYTRQQLENFYKYNTYIPSAFHYNPLSSKTLSLEQKYRQNFHQDMMYSLPRFAITGFDHAMFFLQGIKQYGKSFTGAPGMVGYTPIQTPLRFERLGNGGLRNRSLMFIHYLPEHRMETITF